MGVYKHECHVLQCVRNVWELIAAIDSTPQAEDDCVTGEDEL